MFQYFDQPKEGRFDGEDNNFGLVNTKDEVYEMVTQSISEANSLIDD